MLSTVNRQSGMMVIVHLTWGEKGLLGTNNFPAGWTPTCCNPERFMINSGFTKRESARLFARAHA